MPKIKTIQRLIDATDELQECMSKLRWCDWPLGFDPDILPDRIDQAMFEVERAIKQAKALIKLENNEKEKIKQQALAKLTQEEKEVLGF